MPRRRKAHTEISWGSDKRGHQSVPKDNVLDLRAMMEERRAIEEEALERSEKGSWFSRMFKKSKAETPLESEEESNDATADTLTNDYFITYENENDVESLPEPEPESPEKLTPQEPAEQLPEPPKQKALPKATPVLLLPRRLAPTLASFAAVCALLVLPIWGYGQYTEAREAKQDVLGVSQEALSYIASAQASLSSFDPEAAGEDFDSALDAFGQAQETINAFGVLVDVVPVSEISSGKHLLIAGTALAESGKHLSDVLTAFSVDPESSDAQFTQSFDTAREDLRSMSDALNVAVRELEYVQIEDLPPAYQDDFRELKQTLPTLTGDVAYLVSVADVLLDVLGSRSEQRYLVLFQNPAELRATGGFLGSFAAVTIDQGVLEEIVVPEGGTYDVSGQQTVIVKPPAPLGLVATKWEMQDANWSPDFPWSARKIQLMYQSGGGPSTDGVIAINTEVLRALLDIVGSVELTDYDLVVTSDNVVDVVLRQIHEKREDSAAPKAIIADLVSEVLNRAMSLDASSAPDVMVVLNRLLQERDVMIYARDPELQERITAMGWAGELKSPTESDYLHLNFSNIAGGKTDEHIDTLAELESTIGNDGIVTHKLVVTRTHKGDPEDELYGQNNMSYLRVYVPEGSELVEASGFTQLDPRLFLYPEEQAESDPDLEQLSGAATVHQSSGTAVHTEMDKTVFGNWIETKVGETSRVEFTYRSGQSLAQQGGLLKTASYRLYLQAQAGSPNVSFTTQLNDAQGRSSVWQYPAALENNGSVWADQALLNIDHFYAVILEE